MRGEAALAAGALVLSLAAAEAGLRSGLAPRDVRAMYARWSATAALKLDPELGVVGAPDAALELFSGTWKLRHAPLRPGADAGFRGRPLERADAVVLGDSHVYGAEVDQGSVWTELLAAKSGWRVANLGMRGYGTAQSLRLWRRYGRAFRPKVVVHLLSVNDPLDDLFMRDLNAGRADFRAKALWRHSGPAAAVLRLAVALERRSVLAYWASYAVSLRLSKRLFAERALAREGAALMCDSLRSLARDVGRHGASYRPLLMPGWGLPANDPELATIRACLESAGAPPALLPAALGDERWAGRFDRHWNEEGHRRAADAVAAVLGLP